MGNIFKKVYNWIRKGLKPNIGIETINIGIETINETLYADILKISELTRESSWYVAYEDAMSGEFDIEKARKLTNAENWENYYIDDENEVEYYITGELLMFGDCSNLLEIGENVPPNLIELQIKDGTVIICDEATGVYYTYHWKCHIEKVIMPDTLTHIGKYGFSEWADLKEVKFPKNLQYIGDEAFSCCYLTEVVLPKTLQYIGDGAFSNCRELIFVVIPNANIVIGGQGIFHGCDKLERIEIPQGSIERFKTMLDEELHSKLVEVNIEQCECESEEDSMCTDLQDVDSDNNFNLYKSYWWEFNWAEKDGNGVFYSPTNNRLLGTPSIEYSKTIRKCRIKPGVKIICDRSFVDATKLTTIAIPNSVKWIGNEAFKGCSSLTTVKIPNSVTEIGASAFKGCSGLTTVVIGNSVERIGASAFEGCSGLITIVVDAKNPIYDSRENCNAIIETETNTLLLGCNGSIIPDLVTNIGGRAFEGCTGLTTIEIPDSVTKIGVQAFYGCRGLTSLSIGKSVSEIWYDNFIGGVSAFSGCSGLATIVVDAKNSTYDSRENCNAIIETETNTLLLGCKNTKIPNSVTNIGYSAFNGCSSLISIEIPNSVTEIGTSTFEGSSGLTTIKIPNSVTKIGKRAFYGCGGLTSVFIGNSVKRIGDSVFYGCSGLTTVSIGNSVTRIDSYAFYGCRGLTTIVVDAKNPTYDSRENCNAIIETKTNTLVLGCENTKIPDSVTKIGSSAFDGCSGLTAIEIPKSVTKIGGRAFVGCSGLTSIEIPNSVTEIGGWAFDGCTNLTTIRIPDSVKNIGQCVFDNCEKLRWIIISKGSKERFKAMLDKSLHSKLFER